MINDRGSSNRFELSFIAYIDFFNWRLISDMIIYWQTFSKDGDKPDRALQQCKLAKWPACCINYFFCISSHVFMGSELILLQNAISLSHNLQLNSKITHQLQMASISLIDQTSGKPSEVQAQSYDFCSSCSQEAGGQSQRNNSNQQTQYLSQQEAPNLEYNDELQNACFLLTLQWQTCFQNLSYDRQGIPDPAVTTMINQNDWSVSQKQEEWSFSQNQQSTSQDCMEAQHNLVQEQLANINNSLEQGDFSLLFKNDSVISLLRLLCKFKYMLPASIRQDVKLFLDYVNARIEYFPYALLVYNQLLTEIYKLSNAYEYCGTRRNVTPIDNQPNKIYQHIIAELETKPRRQAVYFVDDIKEKKRISLGEYVTQFPQFFKNNKWRTIFDMVRRQIQSTNVQEVRQDNQEVIKILKKMDYSKNIYRKPKMSTKCLGCTPFFIMNWNVYDQDVNQTKVAVAGKIVHLVSKKASEEQRSTIERNIKEEICGLLNSGGGVILFDCEQSYLNLIPRGQFLVQEEARLILSRIEHSILPKIFPTPTINENVIVNFVPMMIDLLGDTKKVETSSNEKQLLYQDLLMVRIIVRPTVNRVYTIRIEDQYFKVYRYKSLSSKQIQKIKVEPDVTEQNHSALKYESYQESDIFSRLINQAYSQFDHEECIRSPYDVQIEKLPVEKKTQIPVSADPQKTFKYATGMVVKKENFNKFIQKFNTYSIEYAVQFPFEHSKIKGANTTIIVYHHKPNSEVTSLVNYNPVFQFDGRNTVTVSVVPHIKLLGRLNRNILPKEQLENLQLWVDFEFKGENKCVLQTYKYVNEFKQTEYYLMVRGEKAVKKCLLYVYLVTNHFNERTQLKSPTQVEKLQPFNY